MPKVKPPSRTSLVDAVAAQVVKANARDPLLRMGHMLDKEQLRKRAEGFNLEEFCQHQERLHNYIEAHGPLKF